MYNQSYEYFHKILSQKKNRKFFSILSCLILLKKKGQRDGKKQCKWNYFVRFSEAICLLSHGLLNGKTHGYKKDVISDKIASHMPNLKLKKVFIALEKIFFRVCSSLSSIFIYDV